MGHLTNPIGFRLGYTKKWKDIWFVKNIYYPEFLNSFLNIRDYIYFFFSLKKMLLSGIILSHFDLIKYSKNFIIKIYIYHIDLEKLSYDFINNAYSNYYKILYKITWKKKNIIKSKLNYFKNFQNVDLFIFIFSFFNFFNKKIKKRKLAMNNDKNKKKNLTYNDINEYSNILSYLYVKFFFLKYKECSILNFNRINKTILCKKLKKKKILNQFL